MSYSVPRNTVFSISTAEKMKCFNMKSEASTLSAYYILTEETIHDLCEMAAA